MDSIKKQVQDIHYHGTRMGFPPSALPDHQYLEKILRGRSTKVFDNFLQRVDTQKQVEIIRKNILLQVSRRDIKTSRILSEKFNKFIKLQELKGKIANEKKKKATGKKKESALLEEIFKNDTLKANHPNEDTLNLLQAKSIQLDEAIDKETTLAATIKSVSPARFSPDCKLDEMKKSVMTSLQLLKVFYSDGATCQSSQLWNDIKAALGSTPNIFIFRTILKHVANVGSDSLLQSITAVPPSSSMMDNLIAKLQSQLLVSGIELKSKGKQLAMIKSAGGDLIKDVAADLELLINQENDFSFQYDDEEIEEYIPLVLQHLDLKGKLRHRTSTIEELKNQNRSHGFEQIVLDSMGFHKKLEEKILKVQQSIAQMYHINEKLNIGRISMLHLVQDLKNSSKQQELNRTIMNFTMASANEEDSVPAHVEELKTFLETPVQNFENISNNIACESGKYLEIDEIFKNADGDCKKFYDLNIADPRKSLEMIRKNLEMSQKLRTVLAVRIQTKELPSYSCPEKIEKRELNREVIFSMLEQIDRINSQLKILLRDFEKLCNYLQKNPCRKFVPAKTFDGKTYKDYENDFNLYYKMIKD